MGGVTTGKLTEIVHFLPITIRLGKPLLESEAPNGVVGFGDSGGFWTENNGRIRILDSDFGWDSRILGVMSWVYDTP